MNGHGPTALDAYFKPGPAATPKAEVQPRRGAFSTIHDARKSLGNYFSSALLAAWASWWLSEVERLQSEGTHFQRVRSQYLKGLQGFIDLEEGLHALQSDLHKKDKDPTRLVPFVKRLPRIWWDSIRPSTDDEKKVKDALDRLRSEAHKFKTKTEIIAEHRKTKWRELFDLKPRTLTNAVQASKRNNAADFLSHYFPSTRDEVLQKPLKSELWAIWKSIFTEAKRAKDTRDGEKIELLMKRAKNHELWDR
jgi:hypothetical protein